MNFSELLGKSKAEAVSLLRRGTLAKWEEEPESPSCTLFLRSKGIAVVLEDGNIVSQVEFYGEGADYEMRPYSGKITSGVSMRSALKDVIEALGAPLRSPLPGGAYEFFVKEMYVVIDFHEDEKSIRFCALRAKAWG